MKYAFSVAYLMRLLLPLSLPLPLSFLCLSRCLFFHPTFTYLSVCLSPICGFVLLRLWIILMYFIWFILLYHIFFLLFILILFLFLFWQELSSKEPVLVSAWKEAREKVEEAKAGLEASSSMSNVLKQLKQQRDSGRIRGIYVSQQTAE